MGSHVEEAWCIFPGVESEVEAAMGLDSIHPVTDVYQVYPPEGPTMIGKGR